MGKCMSKPAVAVSDGGGVTSNIHQQQQQQQHRQNHNTKDSMPTQQLGPNASSSPAKKNPIGSVPSHVTTSSQGRRSQPHQHQSKHKAQSSSSPSAASSSRPPPIPTMATGSRPTARQKIKKNTSFSKRRKSPSSNGTNKSSSLPSPKNAKYHQSESTELWKDIFLMARTSIIDPADVHAVIDERISAVINLTNPAEITLIQRRVREISRSLASSNPAAITSSTMGNMMGRLTKNSNGSKDTTSTDDARSRTVYLKEFSLDENLCRKLFVAAERIIYKGYKDNVADTSREMFGSGKKVTDRPRSDDSSNFNDDVPSDEERSQFSSLSQQSLNTSFSRKKKKNRHQQTTSYNQMENNLDPIGSAYLLLSYLSENRWDYTANVATNTAKKAKLVLDVNKKTTDSAMAHPKIKDRNIPSPASLSSGSSTNADSSTASPSLPNGVSFQAICFIISLALKGTRQQKITLLFYLLLPLEKLKSMLNSHPAGGAPTWLLEVGSNEFISFASLSHYYYYGGALPFETIDGKRITNGVKQLSLNSKNVIEVIAILLCGDQGFTSSDESETAAETISSQSKKEKGDKSVGSHTRSDSDVSVNNENSSKVHSYMTKCLREIREGTMKPVKTESETATKGRAFQKFWAVSDESFDTARAWNFEGFSEWTKQALDDNSLNFILQQIFGYGIIPSASLERLLVEQTWLDWQQSESINWVGKNETSDAVKLMTQGIRTLFNIADDNDLSNGSRTNNFYRPWGHIGGLDGKGGLGYGVMYCVDKNWWEQWLKYTNTDPSLAKKGKTHAECHIKPHDLSNEKLLEKDAYSVPGSQGSFEVMKKNLTCDKEYVLVPPAVWDLLYELYGGGPPLPRMVLPFTIMSMNEKISKEDDSSIEVSLPMSPLQIPQEMDVMTHPWIINCQICDPHQPYRRGEVGPISIRIMSSPDQPMWRLFSEIVTRLHISYPRVKDSSSQGRARLWKRVENTQESSSGASRYGPWALLYKSRFATFPQMDGSFSMKQENLDFYEKDWEEYSDHSTVDSIGLKDGSRLMFEYAIMRKDGKFTWPREAAAKAGRLRRVADEDTAFRRLLRGVDEDCKVINGRSPLIGKLVDAMDTSGRWYQVEITAVDTAVDDSNDDDSENENGYHENGKIGERKTSDGRNNPAEVKVVRVDFSEFGGHDEWIDVTSDRLAVSGRFTMDSIRSLNELPGDNSSTTTLGDSKSRTVAGTKRSVTTHDSSTDLTSTGAVCPFPGFGACGLSNLGNTCYANSALQCISYMPFLRSYLLSNQYKICGDLNKDNPLGTGGKLLEEFAELLKLMWSAKYASRAPARFRAQLGKARQQYAAADQQDAQELLNDMLDTLHEDSNKVKKKPYVEALEDDWVKVNALSRVGNEAWRRFLRRNSSVIVDVAMGQVLNRVTCVVCNHTSRNFDPFNMLSIPFPTVSEVIFRCRVLRRASNLNCSSALSISPDSQNGDSSSFEKKAIEKNQLHPPSTSLAMEEYVIPMSRLADIGDLKLQIQKLCGISANRLKLCKSEEIVSNPEAEVKSRSRTYIKVTPLPDKEGPCVQLAKQGPTDDVSVPVSPTTIIAFEFTLNNRPFDAKKKEAMKNEFENENSDDSTNDDTTADEDEEDETMALHDRGKASHQKTLLQEQCALYGDSLECRMYDTNPLPLAKAMSRSMWPKSPSGFKLGLRVDAIDHRDHWFPGSVVEIIGSDDSASDDEGPRKGTKQKTQVRIHFDNFSSKWDEKYTIEHFQRGQVRPLYSHANPKAKPTEFQVHHRHNRTGKTNSLFGQSFFVQCHIEWSTVRAGAQILAQAARFLQPPPFYSSGLENLDNDEVRKIVWQRMDNLGFHRADMPNDKELEVYKTTSELNAKLSEIIDVLIDADKLYVASALSVSSSSSESSTNSSFNISAMSIRLSKRLTYLLPMLPFEIRICASDSPLGNQQGTNSDEVVFPFSLVRTIGNYMNARHAVVLHWKDSVKSSRSPRFPLMYVPPFVGIHKRGRSILNAVQKTVSEHNKKEKDKRSNESGNNGGIPLGVCLTEFCKEQQSECWRCPKCKDIRDTKQSMALWRLPDLLTFHMKRYNCSARWREKITTKVNFPLTSLNMKQWCDQESPAFNSSEDSFVYDLIGVVNHYGGMTGGHYVATCKATPCGSDGSEEVSHSFNGAGINVFDTGEESSQSIGWKIGRSKDKDSSTTQTRVAISNAKSVAESSEPLWLQFDDDLVEPIPPNTVVSEMAYVLFYRKRRISPSNIAKYSTLE